MARVARLAPKRPARPGVAVAWLPRPDDGSQTVNPCKGEPMTLATLKQENETRITRAADHARQLAEQGASVAAQIIAADAMADADFRFRLAGGAK